MTYSASWLITTPLRKGKKAARCLYFLLRSIKKYGISILLQPIKSALKRSFPSCITRMRNIANRINVKKRLATTVSNFSRIGDIAFTELNYSGASRFWMSARLLEKKLWGGFSNPALKDLKLARITPGQDQQTIHDASWALAGWFATEGEFDKAIQYFEGHIYKERNMARAINHACLVTYCYVHAGNFSSAKGVASYALELAPDNPNLYLLMANSLAANDGDKPLLENDRKRLKWINKIYLENGLLRIAKKNDNKPLSVENLTADIGPANISMGGAKVTIIIPAYNAENTLPYTLDALLQQTWVNMEIIVVDDCSIDNTLGVIESYARKDSRIISIHQEQNMGAYSARNRGLRIATGEFITVNDSDDWSHPQKIEKQARILQENDNFVANISNRSRVDEHLIFTGKFRYMHKLIDWNPSSLMFRREILYKLGGWDAVRISADAEFINRARLIYPKGVFRFPHHHPPFSFGNRQPQALTSNSVTHGRTGYYGIRREYREASRHWHYSVENDDLRLEANSAERRFPAPGRMLPIPISQVKCDLLLVADFNSDNNTLEKTVEYIEAAQKMDLNITIFQRRHYALDVEEPLRKTLRDLALSGNLKIVTPGEQVKAVHSIVFTPVVFNHQIDLTPKVQTDSLSIIFNKTPESKPVGSLSYDLDTVQKNLLTMFGTTGTWFAGSKTVLEGVDEEFASTLTELADTPWPVFFDTEPWLQIPIKWRSDDRKQPALLYIGENNPASWPSFKKDLRNVFCAGKKCSVSVYGGREYLKSIIRSNSNNWNYYEEKAISDNRFFLNFDSYIHYPNTNYLENVPRISVLKAMVSGLPVVMPPSLKGVYGDLGIYAEPEMVWPIVYSLWVDKDRYLEKVSEAREFVAIHHNQTLFAKQLKKMA